MAKSAFGSSFIYKEITIDKVGLWSVLYAISRVIPKLVPFTLESQTKMVASMLTV